MQLFRWTLVLTLVGCAEPRPAAPPPASAPAVEIAAPAPAPAPSAAPAATAAPEAKPEERACIEIHPTKRKPPGKREAADQLLKGQSVMFHLDARRPGVVVPDYLTTDARLVLQVGYALEPPIPDLKVDAKGFSGTLSFKHQPFFVKVPWAAVWAAVGAHDGNKGYVWDDDVPVDQRCPRPPP